MHRALIFDLGGTHLRSAVLDASGSVRDLARRRIAMADDGATPQEVWKSVCDGVLEFERAHRTSASDSAPIVIAFPGPIHAHRTIVDAPTLSGAGAPAPDLAMEIERATGRSVVLLNDLSAAAWHYLDVSPANRFMVVTVSSGIGSKLCDRHHAAQVLDEPMYAGEIGHYVVDDRDDAPVCDCGGRGHLGAIASGRGIERAVQRHAREDLLGFRASQLGSMGVEAEDIRNEEHVVPAARAGDEWVLRIVGYNTRPLARTLLGVFMAAGLERIYLIGGFAQALGERYLEIVRSQMAEMNRYAVARDAIAAAVQLADHTDEVCLEGCAAFVRNSPLFATELVHGKSVQPVKLPDDAGLTFRAADEVRSRAK